MYQPFSIYVIQNFFGIAVCAILFLVFILSNKHFNKAIRNNFYILLSVILLLAISDIGQSYYETLSYPTWQRKLFASLSYSLRPALLYLFAIIFARNMKPRQKYIVALPLIINALICFSSFIFKEVFYYTETNQIVRGPLLSSAFILSIFYFILIIIFRIKRYITVEPTEFTFVLVVGFFSLIATLLELFARFQGFICSVGVISLVYYYMYFLTESFSFDQLTGAKVRKKLYETIEKQKGYYSLISMDLNGLKALNDTKGHLEGDKALFACCKAVRKALPYNAELFRMGGDEFIILYRTTDSGEVGDLLNKINDYVNKTPYSVSLGYSIKDLFKTFEEALAEADENMYKAKNDYKKSLLK